MIVVGLFFHIQKAFPLVDSRHVEQHINLAVPGHNLLHTGTISDISDTSRW